MAITSAPYTLTEVATGIHRVESDLGPRFMAQYVLTGTARTVLVDTGLASTPDPVLVPALSQLGRAPDLVITSHADVDHCGGNSAVRARFAGARFACHAADRAWIENPAAMLAGNYLWYGHYGFGPGAQDRAFLEAELGGDTPVDDELSDGDVLDLGDGWTLEVLHLPGHTPGHLGLWDPRSRSLVLIDAILDRGIRDRAGRLLIPPRIYDTVAYEATISRVEALSAERLLTAHFPVDVEVGAFLERSRAWNEHVAEAVREGDGDLRSLTDQVNARLGPYPEFGHELAAAVRDHARRQDIDIA
ncbi:MBL fold metallo-hydrolase [Solirubrobacter soli]|uniref:MBL fold metallo-hydrolase n=1 Tax=Solirubrobacter soli TaxID=363832 RepID=UPI0004052832|nr:MBL fold metallo-hydrolase [Solirubrobacter soli]